MALIEKLSNIANAIRSKTGKTDALTLEQMVIEIEQIQTGGKGTEQVVLPLDYEDYIRTEASRVANEVRRVLNSPDNKNHKFMVSICTSDTHYPLEGSEPPSNTPLYEGEMYITTPGDATDKSVEHLTMAIKALAYQIPVDFIAHLGDVAHSGLDKTTEENSALIISRLREGAAGIPLFVAIGNHDAEELGATFLYSNFTSLSDSDNTTFGDQTYGGYCYRDFEDKKTRVYLLNAGEGIIKDKSDYGATTAQQNWIAQTLWEMKDKRGTDLSQWKIIVLSHYPLDYGDFINAGKIFSAYHEGDSISIGGQGYNYSGRNDAKILVQYHGHIHNFLVGKLHKALGTGGVGQVNRDYPEEFDVWRFATPNGQYRRDNYYCAKKANDGTASVDGYMWGIKFFEGDFSQSGYDAIRPKKPNTKDDTSFVVNVADLTANAIYSFCYGAGRDRYEDYTGIVKYSISTKGSENVIFSNLATKVLHGESYETIVEPAIEGYTFSEVVVTMGGVDITTNEGVFDGSRIYIASVTDDVNIKIIAIKVPLSNLYTIAYSFEENSTTIYNNDLGYKNDCRLSGSAPKSWETTATGYVMTGCVPWDRVSDIVVSGATLVTGDSNCRMYLTNDARNYVYAPWIIEGQESPFAKYFDITEIEENNKYRLSVKSDWTPNPLITCFALSLKGSGEDLWIAFGDEEPKYDHKLTYNLHDVELGNAPSRISHGAKYFTDIVTQEGYEITQAKVLMGGKDITASAYTNNTIFIESVSGDVSITLHATLHGITNQIPLSLASIGSSEIYNAPNGYKTNTRVNGDWKEVTVTGNMCVTGYIPITKGDVIRIKHVTIEGSHTPYGLVYGSDGSGAFSYKQQDLESALSNGVITLTAPADKGDKLYFRLSVGTINGDSIITINQEIPDSP